MKKRNLALLALSAMIVLTTRATDTNPNVVTADFGIRINVVSGQAEVRSSENSAVWKPLVHGSLLISGNQLRTKANSYAILSLGNIGIVVTQEGTVLNVSSVPGNGYQFKLIKGKMMTDLFPPPNNTTMEVEMSKATAMISQAKFILESSDENSAIKVIEGSVSLTDKANGKVVSVGKGEVVLADYQGINGTQMADLVLEKLELAHFKTLAGQNPVGEKVKGNPQTPKKAVAESLSYSDITPILLYLVPAVVLVVLLVTLFIIRRKRKRQKSAKGNLTVDTIPRAKPVHAEVPVNPLPRKCYKCGTDLVGEAKFCIKCGATADKAYMPAEPQPETQPVPEPVCRSCGLPLNPEMKFCTACGTPVSAASQTTPEMASVSKAAPVFQPATVTVQQTADKSLKRKGSSFIKILLALVIICGLAAGGFYLVTTTKISADQSREAIYEEVKVNPAQIDPVASKVENIFASADTLGLARIMSPTSLERSRPFFKELIPYMPEFARDFKTRKLLYATPRMAVYEFSSAQGRFTVEFCLGENGQWNLMRF